MVQKRVVDFILVEYRLRVNEEFNVVRALRDQLWIAENQAEQLLKRTDILGRGRYDGSTPGPKFVVSDDSRRSRYKEILEKLREVEKEVDGLLDELLNEKEREEVK
jgi:hypothetical protein